MVTTVCILTISRYTAAQETHADSIITEILKTRSAVINNSNESSDKFIFLTFWDFDGTILKGDCSEGLNSGEEQVYKGLAQLAIEKGYSNIYSPDGGFEKFWIDYKNMEDNIGKWFAYPFIPQMLRGAYYDDIHRCPSSRHFEIVLKNHYFSSSSKILNALEEADIRCYIISASADVFVDGAASTLRVSPDRFHGIEVKIQNNLLTEKTVYPIIWSEGKTEKLMSIVEETARNQIPNKEVIVLAAFGNSYSTDGPFMKYVSEQKLPAGKTNIRYDKRWRKT